MKGNVYIRISLLSILLLLTLSPVSACYGRVFSQLSLSGSPQFMHKEPMAWGVQLQYESFYSACRYHKPYLGYTLSYHENKVFNELGAKMMWNPGIGMVWISRKAGLIPYLSAEGTYGSSKLPTGSSAESKPNQGFLFRPGLGINILYRRTSKCSFHVGYQAGYGIALSPSGYGRGGWVTQCNFGVGILIKVKKKQKGRVPESGNPRF